MKLRPAAEAAPKHFAAPPSKGSLRSGARGAPRGAAGGLRSGRRGKEVEEGREKYLETS